MKRSGKFYYQNEKEVMKSLGLKQTKGSGNTWLEKEDGQNDYVICQLKSTDARSIRIVKKDIDTLLYNADVARKIPMFAIQFLETLETFVLVRPEDLADISEYLKTGEHGRKDLENFYGIEDVKDVKTTRKRRKPTVKTNENAREQYRRNQNEKFKKETRAY